MGPAGGTDDLLWCEPYPVSLQDRGDPNALDALVRMGPEPVEAMRMMGRTPSREGRLTWFLQAMLARHGDALEMAHDALLALWRRPAISRGEPRHLCDSWANAPMASDI